MQAPEFDSWPLLLAHFKLKATQVVQQSIVQQPYTEQLIILQVKSFQQNLRFNA